MAEFLKLQPEKITQEMFDRLPALLTAFQVKLVTGWDDRELAQERQAGNVQTHQRSKPRKKCKKSYHKYLKSSVARIVGFSC